MFIRSIECEIRSLEAKKEALYRSTYLNLSKFCKAFADVPCRKHLAAGEFKTSRGFCLIRARPNAGFLMRVGKCHLSFNCKEILLFPDRRNADSRAPRMKSPRNNLARATTNNLIIVESLRFVLRVSLCESSLANSLPLSLSIFFSN